jgi:hypothetical protein
LPLPDQVLVRLAIQQQQRLDASAQAAGRLLEGAYVRLGAVDDAAMATWSSWAGQNVLAAQRGVALGQQGYVATYLRLLGEMAPPPVDLETVTGSALRSGTAMIDVYGRPIIESRVALSEGVPWQEALARGARRARGLASTDVANAGRAAGQASMAQSPAVVAYRRVPKGGSCSYCLLIATRAYHVADLAPSHTHCHCGVMPVTSRRDPGVVLEQEALDALKLGQEDAARQLLDLHANLEPSETGPSLPALPAAA